MTALSGAPRSGGRPRRGPQDRDGVGVAASGRRQQMRGDPFRGCAARPQDPRRALVSQRALGGRQVGIHRVVHERVDEPQRPACRPESRCGSTGPAPRPRVPRTAGRVPRSPAGRRPGRSAPRRGPPRRQPAASAAAAASPGSTPPAIQPRARCRCARHPAALPRTPAPAPTAAAAAGSRRWCGDRSATNASSAPLSRSRTKVAGRRGRQRLRSEHGGERLEQQFVERLVRRLVLAGAHGHGDQDGQALDPLHADRRGSAATRCRSTARRRSTAAADRRRRD